MEEKQPKRRKDKYNPYTICKKDNRFYVSFKDGQNITQCVEISEELFNEFNEFELDDIIYLNQVDRHYEQFNLSESLLNERAFEKPTFPEDAAFENIRNESLKAAIKNLPEVQRKRLLLYYFAKMTYKKIAEIDGCTYQAVQLSVHEALKKIQKELLK